MRSALIILPLLLTTSCTSYFIRKDCEKLNWYQVGYDAALRGERISNDAHVNQCRKVEAEISESQLDLGFKAGMGRYCQAEGAYQTGRAGETFNTEFCESNQLPMLTQKHREGLAAYCGDGMSAGTSGKKYKNVCPPNLEKSFLPEYKKGRKKYLSGLVVTNEEKLTANQQEVIRLQFDRSSYERRLMLLPAAAAGKPDSYANERSSLSNQVSSLNSQIYQKNSQIQKLRDENAAYKQEIITLE